MSADKETSYLESITEAIGNTPLCRLNKLAPKDTNIYVKVEYLNPSGSIADRLVKQAFDKMLTQVDPKKEHFIAIGNDVDLIVSQATIAASLGLKLSIVTKKQRKEVSDTIRCLGVNLIELTHADHVLQHIERIMEACKNGESMTKVNLEEFESEVCQNALQGLGNEILDSLEEVDAVVLPMFAKFDYGLRNALAAKGVKVYVCNNDEVVELKESGSEFYTKIRREDAYLSARRLCHDEGIMCGWSTGTAMEAAKKLAEEKGLKNIVIVASDGIRYHLSTFVWDEWLQKHGVDPIAPFELDRDVHDLKRPQYDPTLLNGDWKKDANTAHWSHCSAQFKPYRAAKPKVLNNILEAVGNTPIVKLTRLPKRHGVKCNVYVKCEFLNAGGSVKDRIAIRMIELAEQQGILKPGMAVIEPTSGNTGIGLSMASAVKGYKCIIVLPVKMSAEKARTMEALGSVIVRTPNLGFEDENSHIGVALRLNQKLGDSSIILDQYKNIGNPLAHYEQTAEEILHDMHNKIDYLFAGAGTGGTVTGLAKKIKEVVPGCKVVGVDPEGSILADPESPPADVAYQVEGIGYDFVPGVLNRSVVDSWLVSNDKESFTVARQLFADEGILCGGSSGSNLSCALRMAKDLPEDANVVVILPDGIRNYLTKFISDEWMEEYNL